MSRKFQILSPAEAKIVAALGQTLYPRGGDLPHDAKSVRALEYVDAWLAALPLRERTLVRLMFVMFELGMLAFGPSRTKTFTRADADAQHAYLAAWETSRFYIRRVSMYGLRSVFALAYLNDDEVKRRIGVDDGAVVLERQRGANVADRPGPDTAADANVAVLVDAVEAVRTLDRERRAREAADTTPVAASGGEP